MTNPIPLYLPYCVTYAAL